MRCVINVSVYVLIFLTGSYTINGQSSIIDKDNNIVLKPRDDLNLTLSIDGFDNNTFNGIAQLVSNKLFKFNGTNTTDVENEDEEVSTTTEPSEDDEESDDISVVDTETMPSDSESGIPDTEPDTWDTDMFETDDDSPSDLEKEFNKNKGSDSSEIQLEMTSSTTTEKMTYIQKIPRRPKVTRRRRSVNVTNSGERLVEGEYDYLEINEAIVTNNDSIASLEREMNGPIDSVQQGSNVFKINQTNNDDIFEREAVDIPIYRTNQELMNALEKAYQQTSDNDGSANEEIPKNEAIVKNDENPKFNWVSKVLTEIMYEFAPQSNNNSQCNYHSQLYKNNLQNLTLWALKMLDSSAVTPSGLLAANMYQLGNYDECVNIQLPTYDMSGQYCLASATFSPTQSLSSSYYNEDHSKDFEKPDQYGFVWDAIKDNIDPAKIPRNKFYWALCIPSSCSPEDVRESLQNELEKLAVKYQIRFDISLDDKHCYVKSEFEPPIGFWIFSAIALLLVFLVTFATCYDLVIFRRSDQSKSFNIKKWLIPFSGLSNMEKLGAKNESSEFSVMHGLKAICMCQIIIGHRNMNTLGNVTFNPEFTEEKSSQLIWSYFNNGTLVVDTFFLIGGFLTFYFIFFELDKRKGHINYFVVFIYRFIRVTPVYAFVIFFYIYVFPQMNEGPLWRDIIGRESSRCEKNWWANLLYINNYYHENEQCLVQSWYLSCDFHFFIAGTFLTYFVWKFQKYAKYILPVVLAIFIILPFSFTYNNSYWGHYRTYISQMHDPPSHPEFQTLYIKSHLRAIPYVIGITLAYIYIKLKENKFKFSTVTLWSVSIFAALVGHLPYLVAGLAYVPGRPYYRLENALFNPIQRIIWSLCMGWIIIGHGTNGFGPISKILGHRIFIPFSRLTFCAYLIHVAVQLTSIATMRTPYYVSYTGMILGTFGDLMFTFFCAFLLNIMIESPLDRFQKKVIKSFIGGFSSDKEQDKNGIKEEIIEEEFQKGFGNGKSIDSTNKNVAVQDRSEHCHL